MHYLRVYSGKNKTNQFKAEVCSSLWTLRKLSYIMQFTKQHLLTKLQCYHSKLFCHELTNADNYYIRPFHDIVHVISHLKMMRIKLIFKSEKDERMTVESTLLVFLANCYCPLMERTSFCTYSGLPQRDQAATYPRCLLTVVQMVCTGYPGRRGELRLDGAPLLAKTPFTLPMNTRTSPSRI